MALSGSSSNNIASSSNIVLTSGGKLDATGLTGAGITLSSGSVGQTLSGTGTVYGAISTGGSASTTISPGNISTKTPGQLTFNGATLTLNTSTTYQVELGAVTTPGTTFDQIVLNNASTKTVELAGAILKILPLPGITTGTYRLIDSTSGGTMSLSGLFKNLDGTSMAGATTYTQGSMQFKLDYESTFVAVTFSAVPEPSSVALLMLGTPALLRRRRSRK